MFKRNDRVMFTVGGAARTHVINESAPSSKPIRVIHGTVLRKNSTSYTVIEDGGEHTHYPAHGDCVVSTAPVLEAPTDSMKYWEVRNYKIYRDKTEETTAFVATIYHHGRPMFLVRNEGKGENEYTQLGKIPLEDFEDDCDSWILEIFGDVISDYKPSSVWFVWKTQYEGYNITPYEVCKKFFSSSKRENDERRLQEPASG